MMRHGGHQHLTAGTPERTDIKAASGQFTDPRRTAT
jgi:hypothetical protein